MALHELPRICRGSNDELDWSELIEGRCHGVVEDDALGDNQYEVGDIEIIRVSCYELSLSLD